MSRIVRFAEFGPASVLEIVDIQEPLANAGQVRVAVKCAGLNPVDSMFRNGWIQEYIPTQPPSGLGNEFAGVIDEVGDDVAGWRIGDEVLAARPFAPSQITSSLTPLISSASPQKSRGRPSPAPQLPAQPDTTRSRPWTSAPTTPCSSVPPPVASAGSPPNSPSAPEPR